MSQFAQIGEDAVRAILAVYGDEIEHLPQAGPDQIVQALKEEPESFEANDVPRQAIRTALWSDFDVKPVKGDKVTIDGELEYTVAQVIKPQTEPVVRLILSYVRTLS